MPTDTYIDDDWFNIDTSINKGRYLINTTRSVSVNTVGSSIKTSTYDIRGCVPNSKHIISPWAKSSLEVNGKNNEKLI